jgi:hypothetical protein
MQRRRGNRDRAWLGAVCVALVVVAWMAGCASHSQGLTAVRSALLGGAPTNALAKHAEQKEKPDDLLYLLERGYLEHEAGNYGASNRDFDAAELRADELYTKSVTNELAALATTDNLRPYRGYPHELVMIQYYRAFNYLRLGSYEGALVEARKANQRLVALSDAREDKDTYRDDAFMQYLTGLLYENAGEWNDAAVAYRDAYHAYAHYRRTFGAAMPDPLPADLYRALTRIDATEEAQRLAESHPDLADQELRGLDANVVLCVESGFIPYLEPLDIVLPIFDVKEDERYRDCRGCERDYGDVLFNRYGSNIYAHAGSRYTLDHVLRFAFPRVVDFPTRIRWAEIGGPVSADVSGGIAQPLGQIMRHSFNERMPSILLRTIVRALIKEFARTGAKKTDEVLGVLVNIAGVATEQADTRSWLLLPREINLVKLTLPPGQHELSVVFHAADDTIVEARTIPVAVRDDAMSFVRVRSYQ